MPKKGPSKNISRLNEDIRRELIDIIGAMKDPRLKDGLVTLTRVDTTSDLSLSRVHVSAIGGESDAAAVAKALNAAAGHVRSEIASRMHIRRAPQFQFIADDSAAYATHISQVLNKL